MNPTLPLQSDNKKVIAYHYHHKVVFNLVDESHDTLELKSLGKTGYPNATPTIGIWGWHI